MPERILIPLDGSKFGEAALSYISEMVAKFGPQQQVEINLCHVITEVRHLIHYQGGAASIPYNADELDQMKVEARKYLNRVGEWLQKNKQVAVKYTISINENAAAEIVKVAGEIDADLVAMSTHGRGGITRFAIGSVADKVMRGGTTPVLMVKAKEAKSGKE